MNILYQWTYRQQPHVLVCCETRMPSPPIYMQMSYDLLQSEVADVGPYCVTLVLLACRKEISFNSINLVKADFPMFGASYSIHSI